MAKGSSVPACPVRARVRRRSAPTRANDDGPAGLSTSAIPTGLSARGGMTGCREHELAAQERDELLRSRAPTRSRRPGDDRPPPASRAMAETSTSSWLERSEMRRAAVVARRLADESDHLGPLDRAQLVDDALRVGLLRPDVAKVVLQQVRDDEPSAFEQLRTLERLRASSFSFANCTVS